MNVDSSNVDMKVYEIHANLKTLAWDNSFPNVILSYWTIFLNYKFPFSSCYLLFIYFVCVRTRVHAHALMGMEEYKASTLSLRSKPISPPYFNF
jgi:hypothetical protein